MSEQTDRFDCAQGERFDMEEALKNMDGDRELFQKLVELFLEESSFHMQAIREGIEREDAGAVRKAAHAIKGTAGNFAAKRTFELAGQLEVLGREGRVGEFAKAFEALRQELDLLGQALLHVAG